MTDLTKNIVAQLDIFQPHLFDNNEQKVKEQCTPIGRVQTAAGEFLLIDTPSGVCILSKGAWFSMGNVYKAIWGSFEQYPKIILLK